MNHQEEFSLSESELFKDSAVQNHVLNGNFEKIYPITKLEHSGLIKFLIENAKDHFLDLEQSYLSIRFKVVNSNGSNLASNAKATLVSCSISSFFQ